MTEIEVGDKFIIRTDSRGVTAYAIYEAKTNLYGMIGFTDDEGDYNEEEARLCIPLDKTTMDDHFDMASQRVEGMTLGDWEEHMAKFEASLPKAEPTTTGRRDVKVKDLPAGQIFYWAEDAKSRQPNTLIYLWDGKSLRYGCSADPGSHLIEISGENEVYCDAKVLYSKLSAGDRFEYEGSLYERGRSRNDAWNLDSHCLASFGGSTLVRKVEEQ